MNKEESIRLLELEMQELIQKVKDEDIEIMSIQYNREMERDYSNPYELDNTYRPSSFMKLCIDIKQKG